MQNSATVINRRPLRDDVHALVRDRLVSGALPPGRRIQDSQLAAELGVSRTPVREALLRLTQEGLVEADPHRGFSAAPLTREGARQVYPVVWALECLALTSCGPLARDRADALRRTNAELAAEPDPARRHDLDMRWHETLVEPCGNPCLLGLLAGLRPVVRRYECAVYMRDPALVGRSVDDHAAILDALAGGRAKAAAGLLERNWRVGMELIVKRLERGDRPEGGTPDAAPA